jgi:hypothetical protein
MCQCANFDDVMISGLANSPAPPFLIVNIKLITINFVIHDLTQIAQ